MNKKSLLYAIALAIVAFYLAMTAFYRWGDGTPPRITLVEPFTQAGPTTPLVLHVEDAETGLQEVTVRLVQNLESYTLAQEQFVAQSPLSIGGHADNSYNLNLVPFGDDTIPKRRGVVTLVITARDYSWRGFFEGNWARIEQDVTVKFTPPRMEVLSSPLPVSQGGAGAVVYRVSDDAQRYGVRIGETFFPGYPSPDRAFTAFSLFAFPHDHPASAPVLLVADDDLGNHAEQRIDVPVVAKKWRSRTITISDRFIERTIHPIIAQTPEIEDLDDPLRNFLQVNNVLRKRTAEQLTALASDSRPEFLWNGAFIQLSNSQVEAVFADHREYRYNGNVVDTQYHLGFDLAVTKRYPVEAANDGTVVLAEFFGIYGNTIVIDHGYGLQSLYAHLSSFAAEKGDDVRKGQIIGRSGMTGLAAGDHLHFSLLLHGVQVNPMEWWDGQWVQSHVNAPLHRVPVRTNDVTTPEQVPQTPVPSNRRGSPPS
ncbi:MAG: M23 family metallopeptidase [Nitrospira sp.]|nr:M23 family metallopeptidase [Nitrospira sp.]MDE0486525.1 M23 family metallopeptidase [Nitrospira sp.]